MSKPHEATSAKQPLSVFRRLANRLGWGEPPRWCPVCARASRRFRPAGVVPRADAKCPHCGALERHRLAWLHLSQHTDLFDGRAKKVLHIAPEKAFAPRFAERLGAGYLTADLLDPRAMVKMDITAISYPDDTFDVILCSHVLEHVPDDRRALRELHRVLKPDGWAIINVPLTAEPTYEDLAIIDPRERLKAFGQADHVRRYGPDFEERLREAGFNVGVINAGELVSKEEATRQGLTEAAGVIFHCTKPPR